MKNPKPDKQEETSTQEASLAFWRHLVQGPVFVSLFTSAFTFLGTIILFQRLSPEDAGMLTLVLSIVQIGVIIGSLGQATLIQRLYSHAAPDAFNWVRDLTLTSLVSFPIILLMLLVSLLVYQLSSSHALIISVLIILQITIQTISRILSATRSYIWASFIIRVPNSLLVIPAIVLILVNISRGLDFVLAFYIGMALVVAVLGVVILSRLRPKGRRSVTWRERMSGIIFLFTQSSYVLPDQGVVAIGGSIVPAEELASFGAILPLLKPFELLTDVFRNILTTELIHHRSSRLRRVVVGLWGIGFALAILAVFAGPIVSGWLYGGRYPEASRFIPWLAIAGLFRLIEVFPRSTLIGQSDQNVLHRYVLWQLVVAAALLGIGGGLVASRGSIAIAWTMAAIQIGRFVVSQAHYLRWSRHDGKL